MHRSTTISPVHASRAGSLLSRTASQGALELEEGAADLVAHGGVALVVVDRDGGRVGVVGVVSMMGSLGPAAEDASAGGAGCGNWCSARLAGGEEAATAGCGGSYLCVLFTAAEHFDGWWFVLVVVVVVVYV